MWSKIKNLTIPISIKLTILYTVILFCILLLTSFVTITGLRYMLYHQAETDVTISANNITRYLTAGNPVDSGLPKETLLLSGVILKIWDQQGNLLLDSNPYLPPPTHILAGKEEPDRHNHPNGPPKEARLQRKVFMDENYYERTLIWQDDQRYTLQFLRPLGEQLHFLSILVKILGTTILLGLVISLISGIFISRRILRPIRDITNTAKEIEITDLSKRIQVSNGHDELQELAKTFNHMLNKIQAGFEQQRRFVSDASHELRTPITIISGYANMLDRWGKQDPAVLDEGIESIKSEAANMNQLIERLLFLARADQGNQLINKSPLAMEDLIQEIIQETRLIAPEHQVVLLQNDPVIIQADAAFLKQMLRIFIDNSIKYTPPGGVIRVASRQADNHLEIVIEDTGVGIPAADHTKVFDRFYRVDKSRSKATGGTGLGLSIARWISEQHNSTIRLDSTYGKGTIVTVSIPLLSLD